MSKKIVFQPFPITDLKKHQGELLQIGNLHSPQTSEQRILRSEAKKILAVARAIASLVSMVLLRNWDRVFLIVEQKVFMRFPSDYLLASDVRPIPEIVDILNDFTKWSIAMLHLVVNGQNVGKNAKPLATESSRVKKARTTLAAFHSRRVMSGERLGDIFLLWVEQRARVCEFELMVGSANGKTAQTTMPARAQILAPLPIDVAALEKAVVKDPRHDVVAHAPYFLVETTAGELFLVARGKGQDAIAEGASLEFPARSKIKYSRFYWMN